MRQKQATPRNQSHAQPRTLGATYQLSWAPLSAQSQDQCPNTHPEQTAQDCWIWKVSFSFPTHFRGWGVFQDSDTFVNKEKKNWGSREPVGREVTPAVCGQSLARSFPAARAQRVLLAVSRLFVFNIYLHLPFPFPPPPTPAPPAASPSMHVARRHTTEQAFPARAHSLGGRRLQPAGGPGTPHGPAPRPLGRSAYPPALLPPALETQREERKGETRHTHKEKWGRAVGAKTQQALEVGGRTGELGKGRKAGRTEGEEKRRKSTERVVDTLQNP